MRERSSPEASPRSRPHPSAPMIVAANTAIVLSLIAGVALVGWVFLDRYRDPVDVAPAGSDTAQHQWRIEVVAAEGLDALPPFDGQAQALNTNADRPGLPVIGAFVSAIGIEDPRGFVYFLPAAMAIVTGITAAAFASAASAARRWAAVGYVVGVGGSIQVVLSANGYLDQLLVMPLLIGAGACVVAAGRDRRIYLASLPLLGAAFAVHWLFAAVFSVLLVFVSIGAIPPSIAARRAGSAWRRLPVVSTVVTTIGGLVAGACALLAIPGSLRTPLGVTSGGIAENLERQLPLYRFPIPALAAVGGTAALLVGAGSRLAAWLLAPWALVPAGAALLYASDGTVPVQRALTFALAIPILGVALLEWIVRAVRSAVAQVGPAWTARLAASAVGALALVAIGGTALLAHDAWVSRPAPTSNEQLGQLQAVARYLEGAGRPAIVVVDAPERGQGAPGADFGSVPMLRRLRAQLDADLILDVRAYLGEPAALVRGEPTRRPDVPGFDDTSLELWEQARPLLSRDPIVLVMRPYDTMFGELVREHPEWRATDWLAIVRGPSPGSTLTDTRPAAPPSFAALVRDTAFFVTLLAISGIGWSIAVGPGDVVARSLLAPATGLGALVLAGLIAERLGVRAGAHGSAVAIAVAVSGAIAAGIVTFARRRREESSIANEPPAPERS